MRVQGRSRAGRSQEPGLLQQYLWFGLVLVAWAAMSPPMVDASTARYGYIVIGPRGAGKTTLINALATNFSSDAASDENFVLAQPLTVCDTGTDCSVDAMPLYSEVLGCSFLDVPGLWLPTTEQGSNIKFDADSLAKLIEVGLKRFPMELKGVIVVYQGGASNNDQQPGDGPDYPVKELIELLDKAKLSSLPRIVVDQRESVDKKMLAEKWKGELREKLGLLVDQPARQEPVEGDQTPQNVAAQPAHGGASVRFVNNVHTQPTRLARYSTVAAWFHQHVRPDNVPPGESLENPSDIVPPGTGLSALLELEAKLMDRIRPVSSTPLRGLVGRDFHQEYRVVEPEEDGGHHDQVEPDAALLDVLETFATQTKNYRLLSVIEHVRKRPDPSEGAPPGVARTLLTAGRRVRSSMGEALVGSTLFRILIGPTWLKDMIVVAVGCFSAANSANALVYQLSGGTKLLFRFELLPAGPVAAPAPARDFVAHLISGFFVALMLAPALGIELD